MLYIMCYMVTKSRDKNQVADLVLDIVEDACDAATTMFAILQCTKTEYSNHEANRKKLWKKLHTIGLINT